MQFFKIFRLIIGIQCSIFLIPTLFLSPSTSGLALQAPAATLPQIDDNELYLGAIQMIGSIHDNAIKSSNPGVAAVDAALQREIGITPNDYAIILQESSLEQNAIWKGSSQGRALQGTFRTAAVEAARHRLGQSLSEAGWNNFMAFVNGRYRRSTFRSQIAIPPATSQKENRQ